MVLLVAVTDVVPDMVREFEGESMDKAPIVWTVTPVKLAVLLIVTEKGATAVGIEMPLDSGPLLPVTLTV